ncbi:helix-turn-helix domain containing protein [Microbacterium sp. NE2HP2]|uniref:TetR/AcrR family transcriptional regulator n=1 Tax=Microbacterium TaxID=33882 RepID=UPI0023661DAD|nr:TetR/AcrR family transcriptional regulator [Microbacterium plantarum]MDD7943615.1 helix-turn-helix domain containing protein [Microbacterium plantarum]
MTSSTRAGRPRVSSRETLAEAACELFLERGYEATTVADITRRAGVSRSSFFNYFSSKSAVLWAGLDERISVLELGLRRAGGVDDVASAVAELARGFAPDALALAIVNDVAMGLSDELARDAALRAARIARAVAAALHGSGTERLEADILGAAWGGAVLGAVRSWARGGAGRTDLAHEMVRAIAIVRGH